MLPIEIQMQIHFSAVAHQRELAEAFSALREKLLPQRPPRYSLHADLEIQMQMMQISRNDALRNVAMQVGTIGGRYPLSYDPTDAWLACHLMGVSPTPWWR